MNTPKKRLENRTNAVLMALDNLAALSEKGPVEAEDLEKIERTIEKRLSVTTQALKIGRDAIRFTL